MLLNVKCLCYLPLATYLTHTGFIGVGFKIQKNSLIQNIKEHKIGGFFLLALSLFYFLFDGIILQVKDIHQTGKHKREAV